MEQGTRRKMDFRVSLLLLIAATLVLAPVAAGAQTPRKEAGATCFGSALGDGLLSAAPGTLGEVPEPPVGGQQLPPFMKPYYAAMLTLGGQPFTYVARQSEKKNPDLIDPCTYTYFSADGKTATGFHRWPCDPDVCDMIHMLAMLDLQRYAKQYQSQVVQASDQEIAIRTTVRGQTVTERVFKLPNSIAFWIYLSDHPGNPPQEWSARLTLLVARERAEEAIVVEAQKQAEPDIATEYLPPLFKPYYAEMLSVAGNKMKYRGQENTPLATMDYYGNAKAVLEVLKQPCAPENCGETLKRMAADLNRKLDFDATTLHQVAEGEYTAWRPGTSDREGTRARLFGLPTSVQLWLFGQSGQREPPQEWLDRLTPLIARERAEDSETLARMRAQ